jgi:hypothetical protein
MSPSNPMEVLDKKLLMMKKFSMSIRNTTVGKETLSALPKWL